MQGYWFYLIAAVVLYLLWAVVPAAVAAQKKYNFWIFLGLGVLCAPVTAVVALCLKMAAQPESASEERADEEASEKVALEEMSAEEEVAKEEAVEEEAAEEEAAEEEAAVEAPAAVETASQKTVTVLAIVASVVLAAVIVVNVMLFANARKLRTGAKEYEAGTASTELIFDADGAYGENDVTALENYSVTEASSQDENMRTVIAVDKDGQPAMSNAYFQIPYWNAFFNFMQGEYGSYASLLGLDTTKPLAEQPSLKENLSWEQMFLEQSVEALKSQYALSQAAYAEGMELPEDLRKTLDDLLDEDGEFATEAKEAGFTSTAEYVNECFGYGAGLQEFYDYSEDYYMYHTKLAALQEECLSFAEEQLAPEGAASDYYDANADIFIENRVLKYNNVSVRHILIQPDADPTTGQPSEETWTAAETRANQILNLWKQNPTEENFAALAKEFTTDPGSKETGGLYEDFASNRMVAPFTEWSFDQSRVHGDTGIVKTEYGYHIMYFVEQTETQAWVDAVKEHIAYQELDVRIAAIIEQYPLKVDYTKVRLFDLVSYMANQE